MINNKKDTFIDDSFWHTLYVFRSRVDERVARAPVASTTDRLPHNFAGYCCCPARHCRLSDAARSRRRRQQRRHWRNKYHSMRFWHSTVCLSPIFHFRIDTSQSLACCIVNQYMSGLCDGVHSVHLRVHYCNISGNSSRLFVGPQ